MANERYRDDVKDVLDRMLPGMPGVTAGKAFGYPAYKRDGKIFAFVCGDGLALKLTPERVQALSDARADVTAFQPTEGVTWAAWALIDRPAAADYEQERDLLEESAGV